MNQLNKMIWKFMVAAITASSMLYLPVYAETASDAQNENTVSTPATGLVTSYESNGLDITIHTQYLDEDGNPVTGKVSWNGADYYIGPDGYLQYGFANGYYTNEEGIIQTGRQTIDNTDYWFGQDGKILNGFNEVDGILCFFDNGQKQYGTLTIDGNEVTLDTNTGQILTGFANNRYYQNGQYVTGVQTIDGQDYYFHEDGTIASEEAVVIDGTRWITNTTGQLQGQMAAVSYLNQTDSRWSGTNVTGYGTISATGCLPTVCAMAVNALTGSSLTPVDTGTALHNAGYYGVIRDSLLSRGTFSDCWSFVASNYGLSATPISGADAMVSFLADGGVITGCVCSVFVSSGATHEILIAGTDGQGNVYVYDPLNSGNNGWYSADLIASIGASEWWNTYNGSSFIGLR